MAKTNLTAERLREVLNYDPETGVFTWKVKLGRANPGDLAGTPIASGYLSVSIDGTAYYMHRLAWLYMHGVWPTALIDHRDGSKGNNRLANLREATKSTNAHNLKGALSNSQSGLLGATPHGSGWRARIRAPDGGKYLSLGTFRTPEAAHEAYLEAKRRIHAGNTL